MSNNNENYINIYPKSWELYDGREYDEWNQSSHYITLQDINVKMAKKTQSLSLRGRFRRIFIMKVE